MGRRDMTMLRTRDVASVVRAWQGLDAPLANLGTVHKVRSSITDGRISIVEFWLPPHRLAGPLHRHSREDEISFVLAGHMSAILGSQVIQARTGSYIIKPRGQWHTFWNADSSELRIIEMIVPGGLEEFFERLGVLLDIDGTSDSRTIEQIGAEYGVDLDLNSARRICRDFGVTLEGWPTRADDVKP